MRDRITFLRCCRSVLVVLASLPLWVSAANGDTSIALGVFPYQSSRDIATLYQPMKEYLQKHLGTPVEIKTAPNFKTFVQRTEQHQYQLVVTAPHFASLAQTESKYRPLARYGKEIRAIILVANPPAISTVDDLKGKTLAFADPLALAAIAGIQMLKDQGLTPETDFTLRRTIHHKNTLSAIQQGGADAALVGSLFFAQLPGHIHEKFHILSRSEPLPSQFILAAPKVSKKQFKQIQTLLLKFATAPEGQFFMEKSGFDGIKSASKLDLQPMKAYAAETKRLLEAEPDGLETP